MELPLLLMRIWVFTGLPTRSIMNLLVGAQVSAAVFSINSVHQESSTHPMTTTMTTTRRLLAEMMLPLEAETAILWTEWVGHI